MDAPAGPERLERDTVTLDALDPAHIQSMMPLDSFLATESLAVVPSQNGPIVQVEQLFRGYCFPAGSFHPPSSTKNPERFPAKDTEGMAKISHITRFTVEQPRHNGLVG